MAEEVKKVPKPVDPNSAKYKLGKIAADAYVDAIEAKKRGEKVAWVSSNFPVEIPETMGIATVYPENQAAGIAARGAGTRMCEVAESEGYSNDICAYARVSLAYAKLKSCPEQDVAMPDVLLCCSNICSCMIKWYENLARELNIPMILLDIPFNPDYEVSDVEVAYVTGQFWDAVKQLEEITGKKWSDEKFKEVTGFSCRSSRAWLAATGCARYVPSPFNGFDLLNHMAVMVTARGKSTAAQRSDIFKSAFFMTKEEHTDLVEALIEKLEAQTPAAEKLPVLISGILTDAPALNAILDEMGLHIVADDVAAQSRQYRTDAPERDDALNALAEKFAAMGNCSVLYDQEKNRVKWIVDTAKARSAKGVLVVLTKFCDPEEFDYVMIKKACEAADLPLTLVEVDRQMVRFEQVRTNLETFRDLLKM